MRKVISLILCLLMLVALFAGCTQKTDETTTAETTTAAPTDTTAEGTPVGNGTLTLGSDPVEITYWIPVNDVDDTEEMADSCWDEIVADFEAAYPNVTVTLEGVGSDASENTAVWNTAAAANNLPDLVYTVDGYIVSWEPAGVVVDYSTYLSDDYYAAFAGTASANANGFAASDTAVYNTPVCQEVEGWIFNTTILGANDLEVPTTWEEMLNVSTTLADNGVLPICQGGADTWAIWGYHQWCNQYGWTKEQCDQFTAGEIKTEDTGFYGQFQRIYELAQTGAFSADAATTKFDAAGAMFLEGMGAMWQVYDGWRHSQMKTYDSDPDTYKSYYDVLQNSVFSYGFEFKDDIFDDGEVNGIKMNNWGVFIGANAAKDAQKLAACVAFIEFFVSEGEYERWVDVSSNIPLVWTSDKSYDYSMWGLEKSYEAAYALDGTFFHEPSDWATTICDDYRNAVTGLCCGSLDVAGAVEIFNTWQTTAAQA